MLTTRLFLTIDYDPNVTDPESLASAMDRLLETALSTPGIMDEYDNPKMGEFLVAKASQPVETTSQDRAFQSASGRRQVYRFTLDGPRFRSQRQLLLRLADCLRQGAAYSPAGGDLELLEGLIELTDEIADQAQDRFGVDCLIHAANRQEDKRRNEV
jgi:hypothetical protein